MIKLRTKITGSTDRVDILKPVEAKNPVKFLLRAHKPKLFRTPTYTYVHSGPVQYH